MSSDARAWKEGAWWHGTHDGACAVGEHRALEVEAVLATCAACLGVPLYWEIRRTANGDDWLAGYPYPRE